MNETVVIHRETEAERIKNTAVNEKSGYEKEDQLWDYSKEKQAAGIQK